jgi:hypothetical protein
MPTERKKVLKTPTKKSLNKTVPTKESVDEFVQSVEDPQKREDSYKIIDWMKAITGEKPVMWGPSIIGFGNYHYKYATGREGDIPIVGFSPRKQNMTIYLLPGFEQNIDKLALLGKHKLGKSCLYFNYLTDVDERIIKELILDTVNRMKKGF